MTRRDAAAPPKRKLNAEQKRALRVGDLSVFLRQYGRKAQKDFDPNDRSFDVEVAKRIKRHMSASAMDALMRDDEDD